MPRSRPRDLRPRGRRLTMDRVRLILHCVRAFRDLIPWVGIVGAGRLAWAIFWETWEPPSEP